MKKLLLTSCLLLLYACESPLYYQVNDYGDEFELSYGEKVSIGKDKATVEFVDVLEDSRCPANVTCVWAGNGKVQLRFENHDLQLNTNLEPQDTTLSNIQVQFIELVPYPEHPQQLEKEDYKIRLLITRK